LNGSKQLQPLAVVKGFTVHIFQLWGIILFAPLLALREDNQVSPQLVQGTIFSEVKWLDYELNQRCPFSAAVQNAWTLLYISPTQTGIGVSV
jgi:hypothetical protein